MKVDIIVYPKWAKSKVILKYNMHLEKCNNIYAGKSEYCVGAIARGWGTLNYRCLKSPTFSSITQRFYTKLSF